MSDDKTLPYDAPFVNPQGTPRAETFKSVTWSDSKPANRQPGDPADAAPSTWRTPDSPPSGLVLPNMHDPSGFGGFSIVEKLEDYAPAEETVSLALPSSTPSWFRDGVVDTLIDYAACEGTHYPSLASVLNVCLAFGLTALSDDPRIQAYYDVRRDLRAARTDDAQFALAQFSHYTLPQSKGYPGKRIIFNVGKMVNGRVAELADNLRARKGELALWAVVVAINQSVEAYQIVDRQRVAIEKLESRMFRSHEMRMHNMKMHL